MSPQRINSIAELQAEQYRIQEKMRLTRQCFLESAGRTSAAGRSFLLKDVLLPVGAIGLGAFIVKKVTDYAGGQREMPAEGHAVIAPKEQNAGWLPKLMIVVLPFLQQFFLKTKPAEEPVQGDSEGSIYASGEHKNSPADWLSTLMPIVIPLAQQYFLHRAEHANEQPIAVDIEDDGVVEGSFAKKQGGSAILEPLLTLLPVVLPLVIQHFVQEKRNDHPKNGRFAEAVA